MITLPQATARSFQQVLRKAGILNRPFVAGSPFVRLSTNAQGLTLQSTNHQLSVAVTLPLPQEPDTIAVAAQLLTDCSSGSTGEVSLNLEHGLIVARWSDRGMPQEREYEPIDLGQLPPLPPQPTEWVENSPRFLDALRQAMASTDPDAARYATGCVQLDGAAGMYAPPTVGRRSCRLASSSLGLSLS